MPRLPAFAILACVWAAPASAAVVSDHADKVTVTIYHEGSVSTADFSSPDFAAYGMRNGLAFITETRALELPAGPAEIEFRNVTSTIVPQTADIQGLPAGTLERNFDYDLLSPGSLLAKSIGETVTLVRTDPRTGKAEERKAIVRSAPNGVFLDIDGKLEALHCSGLPEKLVFEKIPEGLRDSPTLSVRTTVPVAGHYTVVLSYIATGMNWSADYVAHIRPDGRTLDLNGWITLANSSDTGFRQLPIQVIAGEPEETRTDEPVSPRTPPPISGCWPTDIDWATVHKVIAADRLARAEFPPPPPPPPPMSAPLNVIVTAQKITAQKLGDYKLYQLPELTDVAAKETKQVQFIRQDDVPFERLYEFVVESYDRRNLDQAATVELRLQNTKQAGLGTPLPAGTVSVMEQAPDGDPVLAGQNSIRDTPEGLPVEIETGRAVNVRVRQRVTESRTIGSGKDRRTRNSFEIVLENDKSVPVPFELLCPLPDGGQIVAEDQPHVATPHGMMWRLALQPNASIATHFTLEEP